MLMIKSAVAGLFIVLLAVTSFARNSAWVDDGALWTDALRNSPGKPRILHELGVYYVAVHEYEKALALFEKSLSIDRYQVGLYSNMAMAYEGLNRLDLAVRMYETAILFDRTDPTAYYNLGVLSYAKLGDRDRAFDLFQKARDLEPLEPDVHLYLSYIYRDRGDLVQAEKEHRTYLMLK